jgi:[acyl-carrier-protein] S-malonyltransferase
MTDKVALVFPGQASQEVGMGQALAETYPAAAEVFAQADEILGFPLSQLCFAGPEESLNDTLNTQVAVFTTSVASLQAIRAAGYAVKPSYVAGHSLGEYAAYAAAGVFSFEAGLRLVRERGRLMQKAGVLNPGGMAAILQLDDRQVAEICETVMAEGHGTLQIANYNSPGQLVISGHEAAIERGLALALAAKARRAVKLAVSIGAHSELMRLVAAEFRAVVETTPLNLPEMPIIANITAEPLTTLAAIRSEMEGQLTASVRWSDTVRWLVDHGVTHFIEVGPKNVLTGLIRRISKEVKTSTVGTPADIEKLLSVKDNV